LELPVVLEPRRYLVFGVVSAPQTFLGQLWGLLAGKAKRLTGYPVYSALALELLAAANPEAADWWHTNTPRFLRPGQMFLFDEASCALVQPPSNDLT
jgi:hypothetical protein